MIIVDDAVVLIRRNIREADRMVSLYTRTLGRINARFPGVNRARSKLKAFSEPLTCAQMRLHVRPQSPVACAAGGKLISVFPRLRADYKRLQLGLHFCELMFRMTPEQQPNPAKYDLLASALSELDSEREPLPALPSAFALRLMSLTGYGLDSRPVLGISAGFWDRLHTAPFGELVGGEEADLGKTERVVRRFFSTHFDYPLRTVPDAAVQGATL